MRRLASAFILLIAIAHSSSIVFAGGAPGDAESVTLMVGRSAVLDTGAPIARVSLTSAEVADAMVTSAQQVLINGKMPGTISLFVWDRGGALKRYEVVVQRDLARLSEQLATLFPGEAITAHSNGKAVVLAGSVTHKDVVDRAASVAAGYVEKKEDVVSLLQVQDSGGSNQVLLRVRFAEVSRSALTELGVSFFTSPSGYKDVQGRVTTQQFPAPVFDSSNDVPKLVFSDYLNFFLWDFKHDLGAVIKALQVKGLMQSLAEPNLVAESGKEASFLAGGEVPVPIAQPGAGGTSVTVMYKEFGIRLNFTPQVNNDRIHLKVRPEVSSLDFANAVTLSGFRIPALTTRRTETELELQNGQTFAIAGLINNTMNKSLQKVPGIGDIPILGLLFKSQAAQKDRTELVVMITPEILPRTATGVTPNLPRLQEPFMPPLDPKKSMEPPQPAFRPGATGTAQATPATPGPKTIQTANAPAAAPAAQTPAPNPADAAATMRALAPSNPPVVSGATTTAAAQPAAPQAPVPAQMHPLTPDEQAMLERTRQQERAQSQNSNDKKQAKSASKFDREAHEQQQGGPANASTDKEAAKQLAKQAEADRKRVEEEVKAAKRQAAIEKAAAQSAEKRAAEQAKKQAENDKKQAELDKKIEKSVAEAQAKLKAAQTAYEAEVARSKKQ
jgi:pilus assembly protein CpaC